MRSPPLPVTLLLAACSGGAELAPSSQADRYVEELEQSGEGAAGGAPAPAAPPAPSGPVKARKMATDAAPAAAEPMPMEKEEEAPADGKDKGGDDEAAAPATRSWFPETFLFTPALVTDAQGLASVPVRVPDRLTTWRVLALAHDRQGHQAGDVHSFLGTLPVYVEPVVPAFLVSGDRITLPVQVVNTTDGDWSGPLSVDVSGAATAGFSGTVSVPAGASRVYPVPLSAPRAGELSLSLRLGQADAVVRTVPVKPAGMLVEQSRGGTLASPRSVELVGPADMDPDSARVRLVVHPGALSVLRRELVRAEAGDGSVSADAYALLLAGQAPALLVALGEPADEDGAKALRDLGLRAGQRVMRHALAPDTATAALLLPAAAAHPDNPVMARLATRLADQLALAQRPDGTYGEGGTTAQRMLVTTAEAAAAVASLAQPRSGREAAPADQQRAARVRLSAASAFERHQGLVKDPYTAAAILASGAVQGELQGRLRAMVREAIVQEQDGSRVLPVPEGVVRGDGQTPTVSEATALAALALQGDSEATALLPDLGGALLGAWRPDGGWGEGRTDLLCTRAVATLLKDPLPAQVTVVLERDGVEVRRGSLSGERRTELLVLEAPGDQARGLHTWTVRAEPAVAGLGFSLSLQTWVPWPDPPAGLGVEVDLDLPERLSVGRRSALTLATAAPARTALSIAQPLPAGVQPDPTRLSELVVEGRISSWEAEDGLLTLEVPPQEATTWTASFDVVPTLAGTLHADATQVRLPARPDLVFTAPSGAWVVGD